MSNRVKTKVLYEFDGQTFDSLRKVKEYVENGIGGIIDTTSTPLRVKEKLAIFASIIKHRERLCYLLSADVDLSEDELYGNVKSVFDV